jgi:undecaprenyl-diphosphatase
MTAFELVSAAVLGVVEGLTEFLPVSSTGHLIIVGSLLGFTGARASTFEVFIQLAAIMAVVVLYRRHFVAVLGLGPGGFFGHGLVGWRGIRMLAITTLPAILVGALARQFIRESLFSAPTVIAALVVGAIGMIVAEQFPRSATVTDLDGLGWRHALVIGLFQCLGMWPGMSRAAATIVGGLMSGASRRVAAEYSFLAAVPLMLAASVFDVYESRQHLSVADVPVFAVGSLVAFVSALFAVRWFVGLLARHSLVPFALYRLGIAAALVLLLPVLGRA